MINYNNGKIYKIEPSVEHDEGDIYIGSTTKKHLCQRMATHRAYYKMWKENKMNKITSFDLFDKYGLKNCNIVLIETFNAKSKDELLSREAYYIKLLNCVNKCVPQQTWSEYYDKNKELIKERSNQYYKDNKIDVLERIKLYTINNKERILSYKNDYREKNKELISDQQREHRKINNEKIKETKKQFYQQNKEIILAKNKEKIKCDCGCIVTQSNKLRHIKSKKHSDIIKLQNNLRIS